MSEVTWVLHAQRGHPALHDAADRAHQLTAALHPAAPCSLSCCCCSRGTAWTLIRCSRSSPPRACGRALWNRRSSASSSGSKSARRFSVTSHQRWPLLQQQSVIVAQVQQLLQRASCCPTQQQQPASEAACNGSMSLGSLAGVMALEAAEQLDELISNRVQCSSDLKLL